MNETEWNHSSDPTEMIRHLADRGCTNDFALLETEISSRIQNQVTEPALAKFLADSGSPQSQDDARERMRELSSEISTLDFSETRFQEINRQIEIGHAILIFDGQGYAETVSELAQGIAELFDDVSQETAWQVATIRGLFDFDYSPLGD